MMNLRAMTAVACLCASFGVLANAATFDDHATVTCRAHTMDVTAFSASYASNANKEKGCAPVLKALSMEGMNLKFAHTTSDAIVYTFVVAE